MVLIKPPKMLIPEHNRWKLYRLPDLELEEAIFNIAKDEKVSEFMEWMPHKTLEDTKNFMAFCAQDTKAGNGLHYAIEFEKKIAGVISLINISSDVGEITTWLGQEFWGKGLNKECKNLVMNFAFNELRLNEVVFKVTVDNLKSINSHKKIGSYQKKILSEEVLIKGNKVDCIEFALTKETFNKNLNRSTYRAEK